MLESRHLDDAMSVIGAIALAVIAWALILCADYLGKIAKSLAERPPQ